eukprot:44415-Eustigmatos_ZCMA.PRE.1
MAKTGHDALSRTGELIALDSSHLEFDKSRKVCTICIVTSKVNQTGPPEYVTITDYGPTSAVAALRGYLDTVGTTHSPHRPLFPCFTSKFRTRRTFNHFVEGCRHLLRRAGLPA